MRMHGRADAGATATQAIIGIAVVVAVAYFAAPTWSNFAERSRAKTCQATQRTIAGAVALAREQRRAGAAVGAYDAVLEPGHDWGAVLIPDYLVKTPLCPSSKSRYFMSPLGRIWSDRGSGQYTWVNQGTGNDHRLIGP